MKKLFYIGITGISLFEIMNVYLLMPLPESQEMDSISFAYFLFTYKWLIRLFFIFLIVIAVRSVFRGKNKWFPILTLLICISIGYIINFSMSPENIFNQPKILIFKSKYENILYDNPTVIGVEHNGEAKAYPIRFLSYHHLVRDVVGGKSVIVTYCSACRSGRVFEPMVNGKPEEFRLVGMNHFNSMFMDASTKSWWRQSTGEAVAGVLKDQILLEVESSQFSLDTWFSLHPNGVVMQPDEESKENYDGIGRMEFGNSKDILTRRDRVSWSERSWIVGVQIGALSKAYDWNYLSKQRIINDKVGDHPIVIALSADGQSFVSYERSSEADNFIIRNDSLFANNKAYNFSGNTTDASQSLKKVSAYQEFWHSWRTFHPKTEKYQHKE